MEYLIALALLFILPFTFMKVFGRRMAYFNGPWIVEKQRPAHMTGLAVEPPGKSSARGASRRG